MVELPPDLYVLVVFDLQPQVAVQRVTPDFTIFFFPHKSLGLNESLKLLS